MRKICFFFFYQLRTWFRGNRLAVFVLEIVQSDVLSICIYVRMKAYEVTVSTTVV